MTNIVLESIRLQQDAASKFDQANKLETNFRNEIFNEVKDFYANIIIRGLKTFTGHQLKLNGYTILYEDPGRLVLRECKTTLFDFGITIDPDHYATSFRGGFNIINEPTITERNVATFVMKLVAAIIRHIK